jgi:MarR family transcriptional regulator, temperature-dependent positive regulator of motility
VVECVQPLNGMIHPITDEVRYRILRYLDEHPQASQRELARELGVSLGKVNYCLRAFIERGWVKMRNFRKSSRKLSYTYILTPKGIEQKVSTTSAFLRRKIAEYEMLSVEIERLSRELATDGVDPRATPP